MGSDHFSRSGGHIQNLTLLDLHTRPRACRRTPGDNILAWSHSEAEEWNLVGHAVGDVRTEVRDLVVDVGEEGEARPTTLLHDCDEVTFIQLHRHGTTGS